MGLSMQRAIERIQTHHPDVGEIEVVQEINNVLKEIASEIRPRKEYFVCLASGQRFYDLNTLSGLREVEQVYLNDETVTISDTVATADATSIYLGTAASTTDDYYNDYRIRVTEATAGSQQTQRITDYDGGTKTATVAWDTTPTGSITFEVYPSKYQMIDEIYPHGIAQDARPEYE